MTTPADEIRAAAKRAREEATELAKTPTPNLAGDHPDVDAAAEHLAVMREMAIRYALADWLDICADYADKWPGDAQLNSLFKQGGYAVARAINATA